MATYNEAEIHGDKVELLVRNEEDMPGDVQLTVVYKSEVKDLLHADMCIDELHTQS